MSLEEAGAGPVVHLSVRLLIATKGMRYTIYKTTNTLTGKFYIGAHATTDPGDSYLGSGRLIKAAVKKYGREAFRKEILFDFDTPEEMWRKERELVGREVCRNPNSYNLLPGGDHPFENATSEQLSLWCMQGNQRQRELSGEDPTFRDAQKETGRQNFKKAHVEGNIRYDTFRGRKHSEKTKKKISEAMRRSSKGRKLTPDIVRAAREAYIPWSKSFGAKALAEKYDVDESTMRAALSGKAWKNVL